MNINVTLDISHVSRTMRWIERDQIPFAASLALNETAKQVQTAQHARINAVFIVRRPQFAGRAVKIRPFSTKRSLSTTLLIEPPGGRARADILSKFEDGGTKRARDGGRLAIPDEARRGRSGSVIRSARPKAFGFQPHGRGPKAEILIGDQRTFMIRRADGTGGIYQRTGRRASGTRDELGQFASGRGVGRSRRLASSIATRSVHDLNVRTLYRFTREASIDSRLKFEETAEGVVRARFATNFQEAFARAVASGRTQITGRLGADDVVIASRAARRIARTDVLR